MNVPLRFLCAGLLLTGFLQLNGNAAWAASSKPLKTVSTLLTKPAAPIAKKALTKPIELGTDRTTLDLTNDIPTAEAQANAHPTDPEAQFLLAVAYSRSPYIEKALQLLQRTKRLIKDRKDRLATVDRLIGDYEQALALRPDDTRILYRLAFGYYLKGMGLKKYQNAPPEQQLAWVHKAQAGLRQVIALDAQDIWAINYLGFMLAEEGTETQTPALVTLAEQQWNTSLTVNSVNPGAYWLLAQLYIKQGNLFKAAQFAEKGILARNQLEQTSLK